MVMFWIFLSGKIFTTMYFKSVQFLKGHPNAVPTYITDANNFSEQIMIMANKERVVNKSIIKSNNFSFEL